MNPYIIAYICWVVFLQGAAVARSGHKRKEETFQWWHGQGSVAVQLGLLYMAGVFSLA